MSEQFFRVDEWSLCRGWAAERLAVRQKHIAPLVDDLIEWMKRELPNSRATLRNSPQRHAAIDMRVRRNERSSERGGA